MSTPVILASDFKIENVTFKDPRKNACWWSKYSSKLLQ